MPATRDAPTTLPAPAPSPPMVACAPSTMRMPSSLGRGRPPRPSPTTLPSTRAPVVPAPPHEDAVAGATLDAVARDPIAAAHAEVADQGAVGPGDDGDPAQRVGVRCRAVGAEAGPVAQQAIVVGALTDDEEAEVREAARRQRPELDVRRPRHEAAAVAGRAAFQIDQRRAVVAGLRATIDRRAARGDGGQRRIEADDGGAAAAAIAGGAVDVKHDPAGAGVGVGRDDGVAQGAGGVADAVAGRGGRGDDQRRGLRPRARTAQRAGDDRRQRDDEQPPQDDTACAHGIPGSPPPRPAHSSRAPG